MEVAPYRWRPPITSKLRTELYAAIRRDHRAGPGKRALTRRYGWNTPHFRRRWSPRGRSRGRTSRPGQPARSLQVAAQILTAGTRIVLAYRSTDHWATIDSDGGIILTATGGTPYGRVDEAGAVARGTTLRSLR
jgi:hypothetical protein